MRVEGLRFKVLGLGLRVPEAQRVQSTYMVQSRVSVVVTFLMVWGSISFIGTQDPLGRFRV